MSVHSPIPDHRVSNLIFFFLKKIHLSLSLCFLWQTSSDRPLCRSVLIENVQWTGEQKIHHKYKIVSTSSPFQAIMLPLHLCSNSQVITFNLGSRIAKSLPHFGKKCSTPLFILHFNSFIFCFLIRRFFSFMEGRRKIKSIFSFCH